MMNPQRLSVVQIMTAVLASCILLGCNARQNGISENPLGNLEKIKLLIDWKAEPTYAGFYIAKEKGFYEKRGLDVEIVEGSGAVTAAQLVGSGEYFIASCSGEATAIARSKGIPVRSLAVFYPNVPTVIYSRADAPIREPKDLIGKRIGISPGSITVEEYRGLLAANRIDRSKIMEVRVGMDVAPLLSKQVDGLINYEEMSPVELRIRGHDIVLLRLRDYGINAYSLNLITNDESLKGETKTIRDIVEATTKGSEFVQDNPDEAAKVFSKLFPQRDSRYVRESIKVVIDLLGNRPVGQQTRKEWSETIATLDKLGLLERKVTVDEVAETEFLSPGRAEDQR